jgi:hypothetical protein
MYLFINEFIHAFILGSFNDAFSSSDYIVLNDSEGMWKDVVGV